jgi:hypothetical protein
MIYLVVFSILYLLSLIPRNKFILFLVYVFLILFIGWRYEVGCDWNGYLLNYEAAANLSFVEVSIFQGREPLFGFIIFLVRYLNLNYEWLNIIAAMIFFSGLSFFIKYQKNPVLYLALSFPILLIHMPMSGIRQACAIGMEFIAISYFLKGKFSKYLLFIILGTMFHISTAILLVPLIFTLNKIKSKILVSFLISSFLILIYFLFSEIISTRSFYYFSKDFEQANGALWRLLFSSPGLLFLSKKFRRKFSVKDDGLNKFILIYLFAIVFYPLSSIVSDRINYFYLPILLHFFVKLFEAMKYKSFLRFGITFYFYIFFIVWISISTLFSKCYLPYKNLLI